MHPNSGDRFGSSAVNPARSRTPVIRVLRDFKLWGMLAIGASFSTAAVSIWRADAEFLGEATVTTALVVEKSAGSENSGEPDRASVRYQWTEAGNEPRRTHFGSDAFTGGEAALDALVPGQSEVAIAWRKTDDGQGVESRLVGEGATGMPWSLLLVGIGMLLAVPVRAVILYRSGLGVVR